MHHEYPKYVDGRIAQNAEEEKALRGGKTPDPVPVAAAADVEEAAAVVAESKVPEPVVVVPSQAANHSLGDDGAPKPKAKKSKKKAGK